jgi:hypothetical protein
VATVMFNAVSNKTYSVRYTDGLGGPWFTLGDVVARDSNRAVALTDRNWTTKRFYQLVTPSQP